MEMETSYEALLENANIGIATVNSEGVIVNTNRMLESMFGYTKKEFAGKALTELVPTNMREIHKTKFKTYFDNINVKGYRNNIEFTGLKKGGIEIYTEINLGNHILNGKKVLVAFIKDITDRRKAEEKLKISELKFRNLYDNSLVAKYSIDMSTLKAIDANKVAIELFGYKGKQDFIDHFTPKVHYENKKDAEANLKALLEKGELANRTQELKRVDGTKFWANLYVLADADKKISEGTIIDVTELVIANQKLKENEERYRILFENSLIAMYTTDEKTYKPLTVNDAAVKLFGYKEKADFLKKFNVKDNIAGQEDFRRNLIFIQNKGEIVNKAQEMVKANGERFWVNISVSLNKKSGCYQIGLVDITEQIDTLDKLAISEERYKGLFENSIVSMHTIDLKSMKPIEANEYAVRLFG